MNEGKVMCVLDADELELVKNFRKEKIEKEVQRTKRQVAYEAFVKAMRDFWDAGGLIMSNPDDYGDCYEFTDFYINNEHEANIIYFEYE